MNGITGNNEQSKLHFISHPLQVIQSLFEQYCSTLTANNRFDPHSDWNVKLQFENHFKSNWDEVVNWI
jgi:hypothetical protein